jgi:hypothetical protein
VTHLIFGLGYEEGQEQYEPVPVSLPISQLTHTHLIGKTRHGKSTLLAALVVQLINLGVGVALIDPAGDLSRLILNLLIETGFFEQPQGKGDPFEQVIYLDLPTAEQKEHYVPFNVLQAYDNPHASADLVLETFRRAWPPLAEGAATNIELLIEMCTLVLATHKLPLFPYMHYLLNDGQVRTKLLSGISDETVKSTFAAVGLNRSNQIPEIVKPTIRRLSRLAFAPQLRYSLGQRDNLLDFGRLIKEGRSVLINLNLDSLNAMRLLGCFYTTYLEAGASTKGRDGKQESQPSRLYALCLDEFQNFVSQSGDALRRMLEQLGKRGLSLVLANQDWHQVPDIMRGALNQCGIRAVFHLDYEDALISAPALGFPYDPYLINPATVNPYNPSAAPHHYTRREQQDMHVEKITKLDRQEAYIQLPGNHLYGVRVLDVPTPKVDPQILAQIEAAYLTRYFRPQQVIEADIKATLQELQKDATEKEDTRSKDTSSPPTLPSHSNSPSGSKQKEDKSDYDLF